MYASRNISLCTKDCLCVDACPSHAIYLVMENYAKPRTKEPEVVGTQKALLESKAAQASAAAGLAAVESAKENPSPSALRLYRALEESFHILGEDCAREGGYMLPTSDAVRELPEG